MLETARVPRPALYKVLGKALLQVGSGVKILQTAAAGQGGLREPVRGLSCRLEILCSRDAGLAVQVRLSYSTQLQRNDQSLLHYGFIQDQRPPKLMALDLPGGNLYDVPNFTESDYGAHACTAAQGQANPQQLHRADVDGTAYHSYRAGVAA